MTFNEWFCHLPEGRQDVLRDDKWMLAWAAFDAASVIEREACAKVCEAMHDEDRPSDYAYAIRARSVK